MKDVTKLGNIADIYDGPHATPKKIENGKYFLSISSLDNGSLDLSKSAFISDKDFIKWTKRVQPQKGDLLFSYETRLGEAALMPDNLQACLGRRMGLLRPKKDKVIPQYLLFAYLSPEFQKVIRKNTIKGATVDRIALNELGNFPIYIPDLKTQQSIATVLSALDKKIALNNQINARLEEMAKTLYDYWFVQFDFPDANGKPYKSSGGEMVFDETLKREIPKGWEVKSLGEIENNIITGKTPSTQYSNFFNGDIPFITIGDIRNNTFIIKTEQNLSIEGANNQKNKYLPEGSLCVSCIATVGLIGFTTRQAQTNQQINSIIFKHNYNKEFLYFYLKDYFLVGKAKTGNTFANMNKGDFEKILVLYPNLKLLQKYSNKMVLVFNQINNLSKQNHQLTQLRDFLLPMLMNGQVSVAE